MATPTTVSDYEQPITKDAMETYYNKAVTNDETLSAGYLELDDVAPYYSYIQPPTYDTLKELPMTNHIQDDKAMYETLRLPDKFNSETPTTAGRTDKRPSSTPGVRCVVLVVVVIVLVAVVTAVVTYFVVSKSQSNNEDNSNAALNTEVTASSTIVPTTSILSTATSTILPPLTNTTSSTTATSSPTTATYSPTTATSSSTPDSPTSPTTVSSTVTGPTSSSDQPCYVQDELLVAGFRRGGENWRILPDGTVRTIIFNGLVYKMASDGNMLFYTDDTGARLTRVDLCNITDERVIATVQSMAQSVAVDPDLKRVFVVEEPYEHTTPIPNTAVLSFDYEGNDKKTIVQDADNINDIAIDHIRKNMFWINSVSNTPSSIEVVHYGSLQDIGSSRVLFQNSSVYPNRMFIDLDGDQLYWSTPNAEIWQMSLSSYSEVSKAVSRPYAFTSLYGLVKVGDQLVYCNNRNGEYAVWSVKVGQAGHERVKYTNHSFADIVFGGGLYGLHKLG